MPEGTPLEDDGARRAGTGRRGPEAAGGRQRTRSTRARRRPTTSTAWCGTTSCAAAPNLADLQVNLVAEGRAQAAEPRHRQARARAADRRSPRRFGARIKVAEVPPGPPVLQTLVAEVYGPDAAAPDRARARRSRRSSSRPPAWSTSTGTSKTRSRSAASWSTARRPRCTASPTSRCRRTCCGWPARARPPACCTTRDAREDVPIVVRLAARRRSDLERLQSSEAARPRRQPRRARRARSRRAAPSRTRASTTRTCMPVTYVTGDVAGAIESPVYAILQDEPGSSSELALPGRLRARAATTRPSRSTDSRYAMKWDGEWHITYRGLPRPRPRVRGGAGADLHARRRLVPVVHDAAGDHGGDSVLAGRHPAGARRCWARSSPPRR